MFSAKTNSRRLLQPLDRVAIVLILVLSLLIGGLLLKGDRSAPRVRSFSWQDRQVGADDAAFILTFSRPMDHTSVEQNLQIDPPLPKPGKFSWAGRRMAYTLDSPAPYGKTFQLKLDKARDRFSQADDPRTQMRPFTGQFQTRDQAFVYLGVAGAESGRLILANLTRKQQQILTPENLVVMNFKPYADGSQILFSATDRASQSKSILDQQLYTVTTGVQGRAATSPNGSAASSSRSAGQVELVLDSKDYQNLKFDLSVDGKTIAIQRVNRKDPTDYGLWILHSGKPAQKVNAESGGNFLIAPDSQSLAMSQGQGMAILPLAVDAQTLDFLPKYGVILDFANDGSAAAMVKFNVDPNNPTRSLFVVTNQGKEQEVLKTDGSVPEAIFDPAKQTLYTLYTKRIPGDVYEEQPYIAAIPLKTGKRIDLLRLPIQRDIQMSLAPDGIGLLFDQVVSDRQASSNSGSAVSSGDFGNGSSSPSNDSGNGDSSNNQPSGGKIRNREGKAISSSKLWFLPLPQDANGTPVPADPQPLDIAGLRPRWLP